MPDQPRRRASALKYEGVGAPKVVASGQGLIADRIVAEALAVLDLGRDIPEDLYAAVAEALAWAYALDLRARKGV